MSQYVGTEIVEFMFEGGTIDEDYLTQIAISFGAGAVGGLVGNGEASMSSKLALEALLSSGIDDVWTKAALEQLLKDLGINAVCNAAQWLATETGEAVNDWARGATED